MLTEQIAPSQPQEYFYPVTNCEWVSLSNRLSPIELKILIYLRTIDPYGDDFFEVRPSYLAAQFEVEPRTVNRALQKLKRSGDIEIEFDACRVKVLFFTQGWIKRSTSGSKDPEVDQKIQGWIKRSNPEPEKSDPEFSDPPPGLISESEACRLVPTDPEDVFKPIGTAAAVPVEKIASEGLGTETLISLIERSGLNPNRTIERSLIRLERSQGSAAARQIVENALSALAEQVITVGVKNPGGFLNAALNRRYTSNSAKRAARPTLPPLSEPPPPPPLDVINLEQAIDQALLQGDRAFARSRLNQVLIDGDWPELAELLRLRSDWKLCVKDCTVVDRT